MVDLILKLLFLHCGYLGAFVYHFILPQHWHLESLSYSRKQQEQAEDKQKNIIKRINSGGLFQISGSRDYQSLRSGNPLQCNQYVGTDNTSEGRKNAIWTARTLPRRQRPQRLQGSRH